MRIRYVSSDVCSSDLSSRAGCRSCRRCRATRWARWKRRGCGRSTPLCSGIEAAAQRHIERDEAGEQFAAAFDQRLLGREEVSLGVQHLQIVRHSVPVAKLGQLCEVRSEEHTSELQSLMRISYAVFCLKKKKT